MAPNSLIFVIIIGIWAAYLGKYWLRRRDHLATARSMDRFSESIRVLGQGRVLPSADVHRAPHRSYAVTPGGPMRPQVTVKRSVAPDRGSVPAPRVPAPVPASPDATSASRASVTQQRLQPALSQPTSAGTRRRRVSRRARGLLLLLTLAALVVSVPVALLWDRFPVWGPAVVLANAVAAFFFLRAAVQADIAARRRVARGARPASRRPASRPAERSAPARTQVPAEQSAVRETERETVVAETARRDDVVFDDQTLDPSTAASASARPVSDATDPVPVASDDDIPVTWDPRPVPTPTYAMKQRADHPVPAPAAVPVPEPIELEDDDEVSFGRRVAGA